MNKKLIAVAVAGVLAAPVVMAENSVTIYGVADVGLEHQEAKGATAGEAADVVGRNRVTANSSYIGFKGQEELGGGLKAIWQIEQGVDLDDGGGTTGNGFATRDSYVGLTSKSAGTVMMGRLTSPTRAVASKLDVFPGQAGMGANPAILGNTGAANKMGSLAFDTRKANAVAIASPEIAGTTLSMVYIADEGRSAVGVDPWGWGAGLTSKLGPLTAMVAYEEHRNTNGLNGNALAAADIVAGGPARGSLDTNLRLGVSAAAGPVTVNAVYETLELRAGNANAMNNRVTDLKRDAFWIGAKAAMGNSEFRLAYAKAMKAKATVNYSEADVDNSEAQQFSLGYGYNFTKRSQVYAVYSKIDNKSAAVYDFGPGKSRVSPAAGADPEGYSVGIRHLF